MQSRGDLTTSFFGDYPKAIEYLEQALVILKPMLGDEHPNVKSIEESISRIKSQQKL